MSKNHQLKSRNRNFKISFGLGTVIKDLHLNIQVSSTENTLTHRLLSDTDYKTEYTKKSVLFKDDLKKFLQYVNLKFQLTILTETYSNFDKQSLRLTDPATEEVILTVPLNQANHVAGPHGLWKVAIFTKDQFDATYNIKVNQYQLL